MTAQVSLDDFKGTANGRRVAEILGRADMIQSMEDLSRSGRPAVLAIDRALAADALLDAVEKRHIGRWIRDVLADRGWRPRRRVHFRSGRYFSSGSVYGRIAGGVAAGEQEHALSERTLRVQEMVRRFSKNDYSVDDFLRDRRAEAAREDERWR